MEKNQRHVQVTRNYKDTMFRMIFNDKKNLLSLYNAMNGTSYENPDELEIVTLQNALYMNVKNDLAFILDFQMYLYEHQSTDNPNMPIRMLFYVSTEIDVLLEKRTLYGSFRQKIPTPSFFVFYNGTDEMPERWEQRLSSAYTIPMECPDLELTVHVININAGKNVDLMEQCRLLKDYSLYVAKVREYAGRYPLAEAVERAIDDCIHNNILEEFLRKNRAEVMRVSIFEYDEEREMKLIRKDEREIGRMEGLQEGIQTGLAEGRREGFASGNAAKLQELIDKKIQKGKSLEVIAEELEETVEAIQKILDMKDGI